MRIALLEPRSLVKGTGISNEISITIGILDRPRRGDRGSCPIPVPPSGVEYEPEIRMDNEVLEDFPT